MGRLCRAWELLQRRLFPLASLPAKLECGESWHQNMFNIDDRSSVVLAALVKPGSVPKEIAVLISEPNHWGKVHLL